MSETTAETPQADHSGSTDERLSRVESAVESIKDMIERALPTHAEAEQHTEEHLDRGSTIAEAARAAVEQARREDAEAAARKAEEDAEAAARKAEEDTHRAEHERMAKMAEKPPAPMPARRTKILGWGDGRA